MFNLNERKLPLLQDPDFGAGGNGSGKYERRGGFTIPASVTANKRALEKIAALLRRYPNLIQIDETHWFNPGTNRVLELIADKNGDPQLDEWTMTESRSYLADLGSGSGSGGGSVGGGTDPAYLALQREQMDEDARQFDLEYERKIKADADALRFNYDQLNQQERDSLRQLAYQYYNAGLDANAARQQALATLKQAQMQGAVNLAQIALSAAETVAKFSANPRDAVAELEFRNLIGGSTPFGQTSGEAFGQYRGALDEKTAGLAKEIQDALAGAAKYVNAPIPDEYLQPIQTPELDLTPQTYGPPQLSVPQLSPMSDEEAANLRRFAAEAPAGGYSEEERRALENLARVRQAVESGQSEALLRWLQATGGAKGKTIDLQHPVVVMDAVTGDLVATGAENPGGEKMKKTRKGLKFIPKKGVSKKLNPARQMEIVMMAKNRIPQLRIPAFAEGGELTLADALRALAAKGLDTPEKVYATPEYRAAYGDIYDVREGDQSSGRRLPPQRPENTFAIRRVNKDGSVYYQVQTTTDPNLKGKIVDAETGMKRDMTAADINAINEANFEYHLSRAGRGTNWGHGGQDERNLRNVWAYEMAYGGLPLYGLNDDGSVRTQEQYKELGYGHEPPLPNLPGTGYSQQPRTGSSGSTRTPAERGDYWEPPNPESYHPPRPPLPDTKPRPVEPSVAPGFAAGGFAGLKQLRLRPLDMARNQDGTYEMRRQQQATQQAAPVPPPPEPFGEFPYGDVNQNERTDVGDQLTMAALAHLIATKGYRKNLDFNNNGVIDVGDQLIAALRGRGVQGYAAGGMMAMPSSSEGGTNMNIHEGFKVVGESGHIYAVGSETAPMQLMIKPLPSVQKMMKEQEKRQKDKMKGMAAGGDINASDFMEELRKRLRGIDPQAVTTGDQQLPDPRLLAPAYGRLVQDPDLWDYILAGYSKLGVSDKSLAYTLGSMQPTQARLGLARYA